jgi:uncharacterized surface protein with fasciclin (FAS1) repeats
MLFPRKKHAMAVFVVAQVVLALYIGLVATVSAGHHEMKKTGVDAPDGDIVDVAVAAGDFNTLAAALEAADLVDTLKGEGPFTVFAPTDEAFAKLPAGTVENLLKPENKDQLIAVLTYHVVPGEVTAAEVMKLDSAETVNGERLAIKTHYGHVMVNDVMVIAVDVRAENGVIHVVDEVILPPST